MSVLLELAMNIYIYINQNNFPSPVLFFSVRV